MSACRSRCGVVRFCSLVQHQQPVMLMRVFECMNILRRVSRSSKIVSIGCSSNIRASRLELCSACVQKLLTNHECARELASDVPSFFAVLEIGDPKIHPSFPFPAFLATQSHEHKNRERAVTAESDATTTAGERNTQDWDERTRRPRFVWSTDLIDPMQRDGRAQRQHQ